LEDEGTEEIVNLAALEKLTEEQRDELLYTLEERRDLLDLKIQELQFDLDMEFGPAIPRRSISRRRRRPEPDRSFVYVCQKRSSKRRPVRSHHQT